MSQNKAQPLPDSSTYILYKGIMNHLLRYTFGIQGLIRSDDYSLDLFLDYFFIYIFPINSGNSLVLLWFLNFAA